MVPTFLRGYILLPKCPHSTRQVDSKKATACPTGALPLATACSVSYDRLKIRPSATQNSRPQSNAHPATRHPQIDASVCVWEGVRLRSTFVQSNGKFNVQGEDRNSSIRWPTCAHFLWTVSTRDSVRKCFSTCWHHTFFQQQPSHSPQIPFTSDPTASDSSLHSSGWPLAPFSAQASRFLVVLTEDVHRPMVLTSSQIDASAPPVLQLFLDLPHASSRRPLPCLVVDPIHHRLALAPDFHFPYLLSDCREPWDQALLALCWACLLISSVNAAWVVSSASGRQQSQHPSPGAMSRFVPSHSLDQPILPLECPT